MIINVVQKGSIRHKSANRAFNKIRGKPQTMVCGSRYGEGEKRSLIINSIVPSENIVYPNDVDSVDGGEKVP